MNQNNISDVEILKAINASGYLMEQDIASILEANGFYVDTNCAFKDPETQKSRESDVFATRKIYEDNDNNIDIWVNIICECKNNSTPVVFIGRGKNLSDSLHKYEEFSFPIRTYTKVLKRSRKETISNLINVSTMLDLQKRTLFGKSSTKYVQFTKIIRNGNKIFANHEGFYDSALIPVIKAFLFYRTKHKTVIGNRKVIWLHFPVVVLNSDLKTVDTTKQEETLDEVEYLSLIRSLDSEILKGKFIVDFTSKRKFETYLQNYVLKFADEIKQLAKKTPELFLREEI